MSEELTPYEKDGLPNASDLYELQKYLWNYEFEKDRPRIAIVSPVQNKDGTFPVLAVVSHLDYNYTDFVYEELSFNPTTKQYRWLGCDFREKYVSCPPIEISDYEDWDSEEKGKGKTEDTKNMETAFEQEVVHLYIAWSVLDFFEKIGKAQNPEKHKILYEWK